MADKKQHASRLLVTSEVGKVDWQDFFPTISYMADQVSPKCNMMAKDAKDSTTQPELLHQTLNHSFIQAYSRKPARSCLR